MITRSDNISDSLSGIHFLSDEYYFVYFFALFLLAVASFFIRHYYPGLSAVGWLTVGVMVVRLVVVLPVF